MLKSSDSKRFLFLIRFRLMLMCRSKMATDAAHPGLTPPTSRPRRLSPRPTPAPPSHSSTANSYTTGSSYTADTSRTATSVSSGTSLSSIHRSLPENTCIYDLAEIRSATNNFLAKRYSSSLSHAWKCTLRGKDVLIFQRKFRRSIQPSQLKERLSVICRSHHMSIIKLLGASMSGDHVYLVYDFVKGANLSDCLRNPRNPNFTVLDTWMSRMQIATDLSHGLDYIHNNTGLTINLVHKHIKSSSIIVTEPSFNAKICHFGTAALCGEIAIERKEAEILRRSGSDEIIAEEDAPESPSQSKRSDNRDMQFEGVRGYMSPEFQSTGVATQKSDVFSFGVVILELLSGEEPLKYRFDKTKDDYKKISVIETARDVIEGRGGANGGGGDGEGVEGRLRRWVDRRLRDSFPVEVAEKMARVALECVHENEDERPNMRRVAGKISKLYLESRVWLDKVRVPTDFSVSFAPR